MSRFTLLTLVAAMLVLLVVAAQCPPAAEPERVVETVVVTKEVEGEIVTVVETVEVVKEVAAKVTNIIVWAQAGATEGWRANGPMLAAAAVNKMFEEMGKPNRVTVEGINDDASWADYKKKFALAADAGEGPHIVLSGHEDIAVWAQAGYIVDFEECRNMFPEFDDVIEGLWNSSMWQGKLWAVPQDTEARPMFYNKDLLKELGWSEAEIEALPEKIKAGEWTLEDLIDTAKEAVAQGVVPRGYGYWHRPVKGGDFLQYYAAYGGRLYDPDTDKLVVNREALTKWYAFQRRVVEEGITPENFIGTEWSVWHDTVSHGKTLFWNGGIWQWSDWAANYVQDLGGDDYLYGFVGYALQPAGEPGQKAGTLSHPLVYMITSPSVTGDDVYEEACAVLAKTTTPEINTRHAVESTHLGILYSQAEDPEYTANKLLSETLYMSDHNYYLPNHVMYGPYFDVLFDNMVKAENGELTPEQAAEDAIRLLQSELGDVLLVE